MEYCLAEKWSLDFKVPPNCKILAITPSASDILKTSGIDYLTFADFFSSEEIRGDVDAYWKSQYQWLKDFDKFIWDVIPETKNMGVCMASLYSHNVKYLVDCIILTSRIINTFINCAKPTKISFVPQMRGDDQINRWNWFASGESPFSRLIDMICQKRGLLCERLYVEQDRSLASDNTLMSANSNKIKDWISSWMNYGINCAKKLITRHPILIMGPILFPSKKTNMLILKTNRYIYNYAKDCRKAGFNLLFKNDNYIYNCSNLKKKKMINCECEADLSNGDSIMERFSETDLMRWINDQCGIDVFGILHSRIRYLLCDLFPETMARIEQFVDYYDRNKIAYVVNYSLASYDDFAAVEAAKASKSTKSINLAHGVDALESKHRYLNEYCHYDYYFTSTIGEVEHIENLVQEYNGSKMYVNEYPYFRKMYSKPTSINKFSKKYLYKWDKPVVVYVPIMRTDRMNMPIAEQQPLQWDYLDWHYSLIDYFRSRKDYLFIWKAVLQFANYQDLISNVINSVNTDNIIFTCSKLTKWLTIADKVLFDTPSTAFYTSIFKGLPALAFYRPESYKLRNNAFYELGSSLKPQRTVKESLEIVDDFLTDRSSKYLSASIYNNKYNKISAFKTLNEQLLKKPHMHPH